MDPAPFLSFALERHTIYEKRKAGLPPPWTDDPILQEFKFTNVYRELDRTTIALRKITDRVVDGMGAMLLIVALRWFNRTESFDWLMAQADYSPAKLALMLSSGDDRATLRDRMHREMQPPWVTGSYIIKTPNDMDKLYGVWLCIENFATTPVLYRERLVTWAGLAWTLIDEPGRHSLQEVWQWLLAHDHMGPFMAYEAVSDMRHTSLLHDAPDILTWANPGPGAMRGLNRLHGRFLDHTRRTHPWNREMQELLVIANSWWPLQFPRWEMREVEHTLCEFDKYERVRLGEGTPRNRFVPRQP